MSCLQIRWVLAILNAINGAAKKDNWYSFMVRFEEKQTLYMNVRGVACSRIEETGVETFGEILVVKRYEPYQKRKQTVDLETA